MTNTTDMLNVSNYYDMFMVANEISGGVIFPLMLLALFLMITINLRNYGLKNSIFVATLIVFIITSIYGVPFGLVSVDFWNALLILTAILGIIVIVSG